MKAKISLVIAILCSLVIAGCGGIKAYVPGSGGCSEIFAFLQTTTLQGSDVDGVEFAFSLTELQGIVADAKAVAASETVTISVLGLPQGITFDFEENGSSTTFQINDQSATFIDVQITSDGSLADGEYPVTILLEREGCEDVTLNYILFVEEELD